MAAYPLATQHSRQVQGVANIVTTSYTRPANTTAYTAGDILSNDATTSTILTFAGVTPQIDTGGGVIVGLSVVDSAYVATNLQGELWLFQSSTLTLAGDNVACTFTDANLQAGNLIGVIPFSTAYVGLATSGAGGNAVIVPPSAILIPFVCGSGLKDIYGAVVVRNAYVPVSGERFDFTLSILN